IRQILSMISPYDLKQFGFNSAKTIHLLTEAERRVYADRAYFLGDPSFVSMPIKYLTSKSYLTKRMHNFSWDHATRSSQINHGIVPKPHHESMETTHFSVVDPEGNAVSITYTLNGGFGSHVSVIGAGFLLNNEMDDFSAKPGVPNMYGLLGGEANAIQPNKRMLSSMTPTIITKNGKLNMVLGSPGGSTIITTVLQVFLDIADYGMNVQQAVAAPRVHNQWYPDKIFYDPFSFTNDTKKILEKMRHHLFMRKHYVGEADCIVIKNDGSRSGGADPRGENYIAGF
ncbi:MAG TPA: gamma-glutamyltransferase, partial [Balneolales bacterium]|nr:gamma-glutamyltransferase [Balneolales bacterium]